MTETGERSASRSGRMTVSGAVGLAFNVLCIVFGALMIAFSVLQWLGEQPILFGSTDQAFEFVVGFIIILLTGGGMSREVSETRGRKH